MITTNPQLKWSQWWDKWSNFTTKQKEAERLADKYDFLLYGGESGGGKSWFLRKYPIKFLIENCWHKLKLKGVRVGLFCEDFPSLWDRHISRLKYEFPDWLGRYTGINHEFILDDKYGGGVICFRNLDDPSKYLSSEFALVAVDELTKNNREVFDFLRLRKRWVGIPHTKFIAGTNPGGIGHAFVKDLWIDRKFEPNEKEADQFIFLKAGVDDNPYLPKEYIASLDSLPEKMRKAYREGNWDIFSGQYFTEWDREKHVINPFPIPESWLKFRSYDHGRENPACCKWYALDYDGRLWVYRELYVKGLNVDQIAEKINKLSEGESYQFSVADAAIFAHVGMIDKGGAETIASTFARNGIMFIPSSKNRVAGWTLMHQYLFWDEQHPPKMIYFNTCYDSVRTIPTLVHNEHKLEDLNTGGEDHCADTDRYLLQKIQEQKTASPMTEVEKKVRAIRKERQSISNIYEPEL